MLKRLQENERLLRRAENLNITRSRLDPASLSEDNDKDEHERPRREA
jgi:hypothetical protein